ncbi:dihydrodipicolinate synthase family protein [Ereboglobus luteus]|uniref:Dihydrodipicolinate synthase family protein n=1 Tax=Ereboglobus luteus TaxID=1796921 RepID=A0A2U8E0L3_9BACT|nr:dihydrodipicolinate synthase family protein [Ereboglobus luteus]AWI08351.1 dihydrodipicolinate synthase family protein [Ereboglobus luteus]
MKPLSAKEIRGNWATLLLPILPDDSIDYDLLGAELDYFINARVSGVYSNGSAGEFYTQTEDEFDRINALLAEKCNAAGMPFQIGAAHPCAQIARERIRRAKSLAPSAYQVTLPDWFPPTIEEVIDFIQVMAAEAAPIPLIVYNPPHAKRKLSPAEWAIIAEQVPGVAGMKVPGGDEAWYAEMKPLMERFSIFIPGHHLHMGLARGAHGAYSNVACLSPKFAQSWYELCVSDPMAGSALGARVMKFWEENIAPVITKYGRSNMAADKTAAVAGNWLPTMTTRLRWPYKSMPDDMAWEIGKVARSVLPEAF